MTIMKTSKNIAVYALGFITCSVCAPAAMTRDDVTEAVNTEEPTGTHARWQISSEPAFADAAPNPGPCNREPGSHRHYLMEC